MSEERKSSISVIIPTYNRAHLIGRAIKSILNQTYQDFEIIVVDDSSTDNTEEVIKELREQDERIRYIKHKENKGAAAARNTGIKTTKGEYIAFIDSDDEWFPEKLEKQMTVFQNLSNKFGVVYSDREICSNNKENMSYMPSTRGVTKVISGDIHRILLKLKVPFIGFSGVLARKECFEKVGLLDERLRCWHDWDLWLRISRYYYFYAIEEPLFNYYITSDSLTANKEARLAAFKMVLDKHEKELFKQDRRSFATHLHCTGVSLCYSGKMNEGRKFFMRAIKQYPLNINPWIAVFLSLFGQRIFRKVADFKQKIINSYR